MPIQVWENCSIGSCKRHEKCMYSPCRAPKCDDAEVMRLWREAGLPEYFLGNGGTNRQLVAFARLCAAAYRA